MAQILTRHLKMNLFCGNGNLIHNFYGFSVEVLAMHLKENNVYALPDGREFIARTGTHGGYFLHDPSRGVAAAPVYLIDKAGQLLTWGRITRWTMKDLRDTGRTSLPQLERIHVL